MYLQTKSANISNFNRKSLNRNVNKYKEQEEQGGRKKNVFCYDGFRRTREQYFFIFSPIVDGRVASYSFSRMAVVGLSNRVFMPFSEESSRHVVLCRIIIIYYIIQIFIAIIADAFVLVNNLLSSD